MTPKTTSEKTFQLFLDKVYPEPNTGCWLWGGKMPSKKKYPIISINCKKVSAHRYSYEIHKGPFDQSLHVLHKCDNTFCVNPDHLFLGTHQDNMKDMANKKRAKSQKGELNGMAKLTTENVLEIRRLHDPKVYSTRKLARMFGVNQRKIFDVIHRACWQHV